MRPVAALLVLALVATASFAPLAAAHHPGSTMGLARFAPQAALLGTTPDQLVHNVKTLDLTLAEWEEAWPGFVERTTIGRTSSGHDLLGVVVTDESVAFDEAALSTQTKLRVFLDGGHHGNEYLGVELVLYYLEDLLTKAAAGDEDALRFLRQTEIHAVPIVNVDGNTMDMRKNSNLVDPNRNYDFHWSEEGAGKDPTSFTYHGPSPFSEDETKANADYQAAISPDMVITMHTGIAEFYWPWGWTHDPSPDDAFFTSLEKPFEEATNGRVDAMQGAELYIVSGASDDWSYGVLGTPGFTYEVHEDQFIPVYGEPIPQVISDQLDGLDFMVKNVRHMGAWVEVHPPEDGRWVATNEGWGVATNVTFTNSAGETALVEAIAPGETVDVPVAMQDGVDVTYPILLIETSRVRTHHVEVASAAATDDATASVPGPGLALVVLGVAGLALIRRRV